MDTLKPRRPQPLTTDMWPWGHLAVGYLAYSVYTRLRHHRSPGALPTVALAIGTQFPDLVDKPLAYQWALLPEGRSLAHSLVAVGPLCLLVLAVATLYHRKAVGEGFTIGYVSHPFADGWQAILSGDWAALTYLVYPILPAPDYEAESFAHHADELAAAIERLSVDTLLSLPTDGFVLQLWFAVLVAVLWIADGLPPFTKRPGETPSDL